MSEEFQPDIKYSFINPSEYLPILRENPLWYQDAKIFALIEQHILPSKEGKPEEWVKTREEIKMMFARAYEDGEILFGNAPEYFNDDDRWSSEYFNKNQLVEKDHPDTVVIHHTGTTPETPISYLSTMHLIRIYVPAFRRGIFNQALSKNPDIFPPISSGHLFEGRLTFIGYHYLVRPDGTTEQTLKDEYMGFHAGDYKTNCRSIGIAIVDDLENKLPTDAALDAVASIIRQYHPETVIGHREVVSNEKPVNTLCPGNLWETWKPVLIDKI